MLLLSWDLMPVSGIYHALDRYLLGKFKTFHLPICHFVDIEFIVNVFSVRVKTSFEVVCFPIVVFHVELMVQTTQRHASI